MLKIPKGYDKISKTFRLPVNLMDEMEVLASKNKISLNKLVEQCLIYVMENREKSRMKAEIILIPGNSGKDCPGNGKHALIECCCDECDFLLCCNDNTYPNCCQFCKAEACPRKKGKAHF